MRHTWPLLGLLAASSALGGPVASVSQLDAILGDQVLLEDFEGLSISGGGTIPVPNPLSAATQPSGWGILSGVVYSSPDSLAMHAGFLHGDSSNVLQGATNLLITFTKPQAAVGFDIVDGTGNVPYHDTVTFYHGAQILGTLEFNLSAPGDAFAGWQDEVQGITSARVVSVGTGFSGLSVVDNIEWGIDVIPVPCPADFDGSGVVDVPDIFAFLSAWFASLPAADFDGANGVAVPDIFAFLTAWFAGC